MRDVSILGVGQIPFGKYEGHTLAGLATAAAMDDAGISKVDAISIGNMLSRDVTGQAHLGPLVGSAIGDGHAESVVIKAAGGSGGAVVRQASFAVESGVHEIVLAVGVEKLSGISRDAQTNSLASAADYDREVSNGANFLSLNVLLMQRYLYEYNAMRMDSSVFAEVAHQNAVTNPNARLQGGCSREDYLPSRMLANPIGVHDSSPVADGAAEVVLSSRRYAARQEEVVDLVGGASAIDSLSLQERDDLLWL